MFGCFLVAFESDWDVAVLFEEEEDDDDEDDDDVAL